MGIFDSTAVSDCRYTIHYTLPMVHIVSHQTCCRFQFIQHCFVSAVCTKLHYMCTNSVITQTDNILLSWWSSMPCFLYIVAVTC